MLNAEKWAKFYLAFMVSISNMRAKTAERNLHISLWKLITRQTIDFKYESKNYRTKLAHFVMKVNYSTSWPSNLKHCHTRYVHLLRRDASYFRGPAPLYPIIRWGRTSYTWSHSTEGCLYCRDKILHCIGPFRLLLLKKLPFAVALEVAHLGYTYVTIDVIDQSSILKLGRGSGVRS